MERIKSVSMGNAEHYEEVPPQVVNDIQFKIIMHCKRTAQRFVVLWAICFRHFGNICLSSQFAKRKFFVLTKEKCALFCAFYGFFTRKRGGLRRAAFFYSLRIHYAGGKGVLEHLKKWGRGGCEMFGNVEKQRRNKEKAPIFRLVLCGGDKRDRTAALLNAIQALSPYKRVANPLKGGGKSAFGTQE